MASTGELIVGRYRITARLGRGGMGTVWRAEDELLGRAVAVKELHVDTGLSELDAERQRERTLREARSVAQVKHPGILVLHDVVRHDEQPWLVMELIDGCSLADRITARGPLPPAEAARIGLALLGALRAAHTSGVLHRDLKPANVLLEAGTERVVLSDFGIAQVAGQTTLTQTGAFVGSPEYTAPERMSGRHTGPEADLWSLGVLLCAAVEGESPFHRDSVAGVLHAVVVDEIRLPEAAGPLLPVVRGLLERDPERRFGADETERALRGFLDEERLPTVAHTPVAAGGGPAPAAPPRPSPRPPREPDDGTPVVLSHSPPPARRGGRKRISLLGGVLIAVLAAGGVGTGVWLLTRDGSGTERQAGPAEQVREETGAPEPTKSTTKKAEPKPPPSAAKDPEGSASPTKDAPTKAPEPSDAPTGSPGAGGGQAPAGYRTVTDPAGFTLSVPNGFDRSPEPPRTYYYSAGKKFRVGIHPQTPDPKGPLAVMRQAHEDGPDDYPGYRGGSVQETTHGGHPAALWVFTWDGTAADGGPRVTYDVSWNENGKMYDLWVSAPATQRATGKAYFDEALASFTP
ncbi:serine/threonine-protein kinase [Streptomyces kanamyceticus]|uniref:non-specific serine/threonine protein kinase n=1 Tax=Streptomyces kanamyceticus TaxID=1967 RepID=A0A5J6GF60_STRKN|nr:serine/threonine-protein kinase [Streptomyces kanamyceticus]QEU94560.1 serine/threonine protein kinase [Streptomyces kanamyceticus]